MAKFERIFSILLVLLVLLALCVEGQHQQKLGGNRRKEQERNQKSGHVKKQKPIRQTIKERVVKSQKLRYITNEIPNLGRVRGRIFKTVWSGKSIMQFLDIPYAKSPVGSLRFKVRKIFVSVLFLFSFSISSVFILTYLTLCSLQCRQSRGREH